jgi:hypothetical protein
LTTVQELNLIVTTCIATVVPVIILDEIVLLTTKTVGRAYEGLSKQQTQSQFPGQSPFLGLMAKLIETLQ